MTHVDVHALNPDGAPREWELSSEWLERIERGRETENQQSRRERRLGLTPAWEARLRDHLTAHRFFLLRNVHGWKATSTGQTTTYFTCTGTHIEMPFNGMDAIYGMYRTKVGGDETLANNLTLEMVEIGAVEPISTERAMRLYRAIQLETGVDLRPRKEALHGTPAL